MLIESTNDDERAGIGCFPRVQSGKEWVIGHCICMLMYVKLYVKIHLDRNYGERVMSVRTKEFQKCA